MLRAKNPRGAGSSQDRAGAVADAYDCFNMVTGKKSRRRIDDIDNEIISIPVGLAKVNRGAKRLLRQEGSSLGVRLTFDMQMTVSS